MVKWAILNDRKFNSNDIIGPSQTADRMYDWACAIERNRILVKAFLYSRDAPLMRNLMFEENKRIAIPIVVFTMSDSTNTDLDVGASFLTYAYVGMIINWVCTDSTVPMLEIYIRFCKTMRAVLKPSVYDYMIGRWAEEHAALRRCRRRIATCGRLKNAVAATGDRAPASAA